MIRYTCVLAAFCLQFVGFSQLVPLKPGDRMPNIPGVTLPSKKLTLIDIWSTSCSNCYKAFPELERLQKEFTSDIQVVLVNMQSPDSTDRFFVRRKIKKPALAMYSGIGEFGELFPNNYVPWHVWIDGNGIVRYITNGYNALPQHVEQFLRTGSAPMAQLQIGLLEDEKKLETDFVYHSKLMRHVPGYTAGNIDGIKWGEHSIRFAKSGGRLTLLKFAFAEKMKYDFTEANRVVLEVKDPTQYIFPTERLQYDSWLEKNSYTYDLLVPDAWKDRVYKIAQQELCRLFGVKVSVEKRKVSAYKLVRTDPSDHHPKFELTGEIPKVKVKSDSLFQRYKGKRMGDFYANLHYYLLLHRAPQPLVDGTGFKGRLDMEIPLQYFNPFQYDKLRVALQAYGLDLITSEEEMDVLVIRETIQ